MEQNGRSATGPRKRVLIVDDEEIVRRIMRRQVGERYESVLAASATVARDVLGGDKDFCAILCDLHMPGMSGIDLYHWVRRQDGDLAARMIFVTGGAYDQETAGFLESITNPTIEKPYEPHRLLNLLDHVATSSDNYVRFPESG